MWFITKQNKFRKKCRALIQHKRKTITQQLSLSSKDTDITDKPELFLFKHENSMTNSEIKDYQALKELK